MPVVGQVAGDIAHAGPTRRRHYAEAALRNAIGHVAGAPKGQRNATLNKQMYGLMRFARIGDLTMRGLRLVSPA